MIEHLWENWEVGYMFMAFTVSEVIVKLASLGFSGGLITAVLLIALLAVGWSWTSTRHRLKAAESALQLHQDMRVIEPSSSLRAIFNSPTYVPLVFTDLAEREEIEARAVKARQQEEEEAERISQETRLEAERTRQAWQMLHYRNLLDEKRDELLSKMKASLRELESLDRRDPAFDAEHLTNRVLQWAGGYTVGLTATALDSDSAEADMIDFVADEDKEGASIREAREYVEELNKEGEYLRPAPSRLSRSERDLRGWR